MLRGLCITIFVGRNQPLARGATRAELATPPWKRQRSRTMSVWVVSENLLLLLPLMVDDGVVGHW